MSARYDWLLAAGEASQRGPQFLPPSSILAIARALTDLGQRTAILVIDPQHDPDVVGRDSHQGVPLFFTSRPAASLPALWFGIGRPRLLCLPNQLGAFGLAETPGLPLCAWLGEDDLPPLAARRLPGRPLLLADSRLVAEAAARLTRRPVAVLTPPLTQTDIGAATSTAPSAKGVIAVFGARPQDGIELVLQLAAVRRDLRFIIAEWPILDDETRAELFAGAGACRNIDWRRPTSPSALAAIIAEAALVLAPAMQLAGHRDWILQAARFGRPVLRSDLADGAGLFDADQQVVPADAPVADWLDRLARSSAKAGAASAPPAGDFSAAETAAQLLAHALDMIEAPST